MLVSVRGIVRGVVRGVAAANRHRPCQRIFAALMKVEHTTAAARRTQKERSDVARARLLDAAVTLICRQGMANTTTLQVATAAGLTRGAIQHHFGGRAELFAAVVQQVEASWLKSFEAAAPDRTTTLRERIDILADHLWGVVQTPVYRAAIDICFNSRADDELQRVVQKAVDISSADFARYWQRTFSPDIADAKIHEACALISALSQGLVISGIFTGEPDRVPASAQTTFVNAKRLVANFMLDAD